MLDQKKFIIMGSQANDPITRSLSHLKNSHQHIISLADFINSVWVFDEINNDQTKIHWEKNGVYFINDDNHIMLSRLFYHSESNVDDFKPEDKDYALSEIRSYLGFALDAFNHLNNELDENGHEILHTLPEQWKKIKNKNSQLIIPEYYWGDHRFNHLSSTDLVYSDIGNFKRWSGHNAPDDRLVFCFKKPRGNAYFSLVINEAALITTPDQKADSVIINTIIEQSLLLAKQFNYFISESLYFYDGEKITTAFISPLVQYSKENDQFETFVQTHIYKALQS